MRICPLILLIFALGAGAPTRAESPARILTRAVDALCPLPGLSGFEAQIRLPGTWVLDEGQRPEGPAPRIRTLRLALPEGGALELERRQFNGQLRQFRATYLDTANGPAPAPQMMAIADGSCAIQSGRALRQEGAVWRYLDQLEGDLETLKWSETLQAPWPEGRDPGGVRVALVDSGLAYDLPLFRDRLARDAQGRPLGYDFWDMDPYPYDGDTARGAFLPIRHGTAVASVLVAEAPDAALIPLRYPRPDMTRMADLVAHAARAGARILAMPLGSNAAQDWDAFARALATHDMLAIVSAGNNGRDIDARAVYPAALEIENMITVTSADAFGRLAEGSNWGARHVDILLPAENVAINDFRGAAGTASGSSYAVPRLAALAARILAAEPGLETSALRERVLARAAPSPYARADAVAVGWIPDPRAD